MATSGWAPKRKTNVCSTAGKFPSVISWAPSEKRRDVMNTPLRGRNLMPTLKEDT
jgi:hypothetical protein